MSADHHIALVASGTAGGLLADPTLRGALGALCAIVLAEIARQVPGLVRAASGWARRRLDERKGKP